MHCASFGIMDDIFIAVHTAQNGSSKAVDDLFKARLPHEGDAAAHALTDQIMLALEDYELTRRPVTCGWFPDLSAN